MMTKRDSHLTRVTRACALLLALVLGLVVPVLEAAAQEAGSDDATTEVLAEVPSTGGRRPGPVTVVASTVTAPAEAAPAPPAAPLAGVAPVELRIDSVGVDAAIELGAVTDGAMQDPSGPW